VARLQTNGARAGIAALIVVGLVAGTWAALSLWGGSGQAGPAATGSPSPTTDEKTPLPTVSAPVPANTSAPGTVGGDGSDFAQPFIAAETAARTDTTKSVDFSTVAIGDALQDLQVNAEEMNEDGLRQVGSPELVKATVTKKKMSAKPPTMTVNVCLDYTNVDLVAPDGTSVKNPKAPQRVPSILVLHQVDGRWLVAKRTFPAKTTC